MTAKKLTVNLSQTGYTFRCNGEIIRIRKKTVFSHILSYTEVKLIVPYDDLLVVPLHTIFFIRILSRGNAVILCSDGSEHRITLMKLAAIMLKHIVHPPYCSAMCKRLFHSMSGRIKSKNLLRDIEKEIDGLLSKIDEKHEYRSVDLSKPVVYLRAILAYDLRAGGSVGHIAGVLNNLGHFSAPPLFITTDTIPTVRGDIETRIISPGDKFSGVSELRDMYFSRTFERETLAVLKNIEPAFIYQRESLFNYSGVKLSRRLNIPLVLEFNGSEIWVCNHWGTPLKYESIARKIELCSLRAADVIIVVSNALKESLISMGIDSGKILVNPNGVDPDVYSPDVSGIKVRDKYNLGNKTVIGFIGTFGHWHGAELLAEAFGRLLNEYNEYRENVRLLMIGDGLKMPLVKECLARFNVAHCCTLTGLLPQVEGPAHLAACDILVSPHRPNPDGTPFFGSPTKLFEYMAMGKGIVASSLDQIGEVLDHKETAWLVPPGDIDALGQGIKALIDDEDLRKKMGESARKEVLAKYTWKEHTRKIIEKVRKS